MPMARKVSLQDFLPVLTTLRLKIPTLYFRPGCDQMVLLIGVRPDTMFGTFDHGATISLSQYFRPMIQLMGV